MHDNALSRYPQDWSVSEGFKDEKHFSFEVSQRQWVHFVH